MYTIQGGSAEGAQRYTPYASKIPPSGYSIKPFSQIHFGRAGQDHFRTPQAVAPAAGFEDLNNQEQQESRKGNSCTFLWKSSGQSGHRDATAKPDFRLVDSSKTANLKQQEPTAEPNLREAFSAFSSLIKAPTEDQSEE